MRLKYIDILKAFAIIAVVLYHSGFLTFGYLGVDLFLVINGFFITKTLNRLFLNCDKSWYGSYFSFEISRIARLMPVLIVAGIVCMAFGYWTMLPDDYENLSESVVATNLFANNILAAITTKNYWDVVNEYKPLMHTWYVGLVMQFYLVYPFLFIFAKLDKKHPRRFLLVLVSFLAVVSLLVFILTTDVAKRFYFLPSRFFEFAAGGIVALTWKPNERKYSLPNWLSFCCYAIVLAIMGVSNDFVPAHIKLLAIVAMSMVLVMSGNALENKVTGNPFLARIGAMSYSIFVWHQVLLAFYRYTISSHFTMWSYTLFLIVVTVLSWLTYHFIERKTSEWLKGEKSKLFFYIIMFLAFVGLTAFAGSIYKRGGVVRDVPELYISKEEHVNHKAYNEKINQYDRPFETEKPHWLIVGNSFGRDFSNVILESPISDSIELSYIRQENCTQPQYSERYATADRIFLSSLGTDEQTVKEFEKLCTANGFDVANLVIVGTKNFGESNGRFYVKRNSPDYFNLRTEMEPGYYERNERMREAYGERYLDLISLVIDENHTVPVFTPDHHYLSQDCRHFSKGGAIWFGQLIDFQQYLK